MKKLLLAVTAAAFTTAASAQLPNGSVAPDFTGTDLNGNTHNLYSYLDQGYTVIVDISATWCAPCWQYHNTHHLANLYTQYGPGTAADKVMVLFIEGDQQTTVAHLNGQGSLTQGNWVTGTPYPIINDHTIAQLLQVNAFPTLYKICPNRLTTRIGTLTTSALWATAQDCPVANMPHDAALLPVIGSLNTCLGQPVPLSVRMQNAGLEPLTSATIQAREGADVIGTVEWTGQLGTYAWETIAIADYSPSSGTTTITYEITSADGLAANNTSTGTVVASGQTMPGTAITLELRTDQYGYETTWRLMRPNGQIIAQDPPGSYAANTVYTYNWNLQDENCFIFEINDSHGDGICCGFGQGYYKLMVDGHVIIEGGEFTHTDIRPFKVSTATASIQENELEAGYSLFPNPTTGLVTLGFTLEEAGLVEVRVTDLLGQMVTTTSTGAAPGQGNIVMDLSALAAGTYFVNLHAGGMLATRKVTIAR
jgi:hypothetical protein